jgi:hypothetical protein
MKSIGSLTLATTLAVLASTALHAGADVFCRAKKGNIAVRAACRKKEIQLDLADFGGLGQAGVPGAPGTPGTPGAPGTAGTDGQLRIYGDGSAGARTVAADENWADPLVAPTNFQFTDLTVVPGVKLTVPSGTVIRCTGTFTNNGTVEVLGAAVGADRDGVDAGTIEASVRNANPGLGLSPAGSGEAGPATSPLTMGEGADAMNEATARQLVKPGPLGGGGGGGGLSGTGGQGGGTLLVLAATAVMNQLVINADGHEGTNGSGGGGGGVVILASRGTVSNAGPATISAHGADGFDSTASDGAGGGGGGGIVHLLAPTIVSDGTVTVDGGAAGAAGAAASVTSNPRSAGGGGGACGGNGGSGGAVSTAGTPGSAEAGHTGHFLQSHVDPTALL